jgi:hypothetical protein
MVKDLYSCLNKVKTCVRNRHVLHILCLQFVCYEGCEFIVEHRIKLNCMYYSEYFYCISLNKTQIQHFAVTLEILTLLIQNVIAANKSGPFSLTFLQLFTWNLSYCYPFICFIDTRSVPK